jgi:hypothetical protein
MLKGGEPCTSLFEISRREILKTAERVLLLADTLSAVAQDLLADRQLTASAQPVFFRRLLSLIVLMSGNCAISFNCRGAAFTTKARAEFSQCGAPPVNDWRKLRVSSTVCVFRR